MLNGKVLSPVRFRMSGDLAIYKQDKCLCEELNRDDNKIENAIKRLKEISWKIGTTGVDYLSEKDGKKMRECVVILENRIDELER